MAALQNSGGWRWQPGQLCGEMAHRARRQTAVWAERAGTSSLLPPGEISLQRFSLKMCSPVSKMLVVFLPCPPPKRCLKLALLPSANSAVNYGWQGVDTTNSREGTVLRVRDARGVRTGLVKAGC